MPFASHGAAGLRGATRKTTSLLHANGPGLRPPGGARAPNARSIHISSFVKAVPLPRPSAPTSVANKLFTHSRNFLSTVFAQLAAPGLRVPTSVPAHPQAGSRSLMHTNALHNNSIQKGFSLPTRLALQSGSRTYFLPRAPPVPRSVAQVGLGTARNFSSSRPLFQDLVENVPVIGRALYEADIEWDQKMRKEQEKMKRATKGKENVKKTREMLKAKDSDVLRIILEDSTVQSKSEEMEHYFPNASVAPVTTLLLIPLAPTPSSRLPLSNDTRADRLLPFPQLASIHATHSTHSLRVSPLFTRLDQAHVWERGVKCSAYGQGRAQDDEGTCTVLKLEFLGWTAAEVRSVIGESGTGWCVLEEIREDDSEDAMLEEALSDISDEDLFATRHPTGMDMPETVTVMDPAQSFVLPTLDFSSSFISNTSSSKTPSEAEFNPPLHYSDPWLSSGASSPSLSPVSSFEDIASMAESERWVAVPEPPSQNGWFSDGRSRDRSVMSARSAEPRENLFY